MDKKERIKEELKKLNLDKKSIDKIILNYSLENIEEKLELLQIKRKVVNPAGWLITALKEDYATLEASEKPEELIPEVKKKEGIKRLFFSFLFIVKLIQIGLRIISFTLCRIIFSSQLKKNLFNHLLKSLSLSLSHLLILYYKFSFYRRLLLK